MNKIKVKRNRKYSFRCTNIFIAKTSGRLETYVTDFV